MNKSNTLSVLALTAVAVATTYFAFKWSNQPKKKKGGPGSGKGTNCSKIVDTFGYVHLSAGDLLRDERKSGSKLGDMIEAHIVAGTIVPAEVTVNLLKNAMEKSGSDKFLVDGFPRDTDNLKCWESTMTTYTDVQFLLFLDCPESIMVDRLLERGKASSRSDDNIESIKKRLVTYEASTRPIIDIFKAAGKVRTVDSNRDPVLVFKDVSTIFQNAANL